MTDILFAGIRIYSAIFGLVAFVAVISMGAVLAADVLVSLVIMGGLWT